MKKCIKLTILAVLTLALTVVASAAQEASVCPCCGKNISAISWSALPSSKVIPAGHYRLSKNATMTQYQTVESNVTLDLNGCTLTTASNKRAFYVSSGTMHVLDSVGTGSIVGGGTSADSGGLFRVRSGATLNIYSGTFSGGKVGPDAVGGNLRVEGTFNLYGGTITSGLTTDDHGGNISLSGGTVNIYGGTVENGQTFGGGRGGNFYVTSAGRLNVYGGTITGGISAGKGGNIFAYSGATIAIYGGRIDKGVSDGGGNDIYIAGEKDGKYSSLEIYGGIIGDGTDDLIQYSENNPITIYNGQFFQDVSAYLADCACMNGYTVWNYGHAEGICDASCPFVEASKNVAVFYTGEHYFVGDSQPNTCHCTHCGYVYCNPDAMAVADGKPCTTLTDVTGNTDLLSDATVEELVVTGTLNLNGHTLNAQTVVAATGDIIDVTQGQGLLKADSLSLAEKNPQLALSCDAGVRFVSMTPDTTLERLDDNTVRVRFVFEEKAAETMVDDLIKAGNTDVSVEFYLTWTNSAGQSKEKTYVCAPELLQKYAQKWDGRRFVATITGVENVTNLTCTVRLSANGVTYSDTTLKNYEAIKNVLSWENINSYPLKTSDMTVDEMRQLCVDFFEYSKTFLWTPDEDVDYVRNSSGTKDSMEQGTIYGGMPYVGNASGSPYRMMDYIDPVTGLVDMKKALPSLANGGTLDMADLLYFGSQCAKTASLGWCRVINSANLNATMYFVPSQGVILLGNIEMDESISYWTSSYQTTTVCKANGEQVMYEAYAQLQKADGLVQYTTAGHVIMAYSDAVVVRNADGTINGKESYVNIIHQAQKWTDQENEYGDQYQMKSSVNTKMTFASLYSGVYIPFTFREFHGQAEIAETILNISDADGNILIRGVISEEDRSVQITNQTENLTFSQLQAATLKSNYGISDVYVVLYNERGQEIYRYAVRNYAVCRQTLALKENDGNVTIWQYAEPETGKTYQAQIIVQCATGERPTLYSGQLTMDN